MAPGTILSALSENTLMPVSLVMALGGIVFWASSIAARADMANDRIAKIESREMMLLQMREDVVRISTRVDFIYDRIKEEQKR